MPKKTPVDDALEAKHKLAEERRAEEHQMWEQWRADPTPENIHPLMQRFEPVFRQKSKMWRAPHVNEPAFKANLKLQAIDAFKTYDPSRGTALRTHLENRLKKAMRFNAQQQNLARIPEAKTYQIDPIRRAQDELREEYGRDPTPAEISEFLNPMMSTRKKLTPQKVEQIQAAQVRDIMSEPFETDPVPKVIARERQVVSLLRPALTSDQQVVFDHLYGLNGRPQVTSTGQLAKILGKSPSQISRLRTGIFQTFQRYNQ